MDEVTDRAPVKSTPKVSGVTKMSEVEINEVPITAPPVKSKNSEMPQTPEGGDNGCGCATESAIADAGKPAPNYIYALGRVVARFPTLGLEKEFARAAGMTETTGLTDRETFHAVLSKPENRYLTRKICWAFAIEGMPAYVLFPRHRGDLEALIEAIRPVPKAMDVDVIRGEKGPIAPPEMCGGLQLPMVAFDHAFSFDRDSMIKSIPRPESISEKDDPKFRSAAGELFDRIMQVADNMGAADEHRALNYLAVRYPAIYAKAAEEFGRNFSLTGVVGRPSRLSGARKVVSAIFSYTHRETDVTEKYFVRVDTTEVFPFMVTKMAPYYDR